MSGPRGEERWESQSQIEKGSRKRSRMRGRSRSREKEGGGEEEQGAAKTMKMGRSQSEEFKVIFKLKGEQSGFSSFNGIWLTRALKGELGDILNARILANWKLLVMCKTAVQLAKAASLQAIGMKRLRVLVPGTKVSGLKGVIYGVSVETTIEN